MPDLVLFLPACFALNLAFGPNNLLALTHGAASGTGFALRAGAGRLMVFVPMIAASAAGLGLVLAASATAFGLLKIAGALYLVWIGVKLLIGSGRAAAPLPPAPGLDEAFRREAMVAIGNPKAILIFAAFFPQFVDPARYWQDYLALGALFLVLEFVALGLYAALGRVLARAGGRCLPRLQQASGAAMILFGLLLAFSRRPAAV